MGLSLSINPFILARDVTAENTYLKECLIFLYSSTRILAHAMGQSISRGH